MQVKLLKDLVKEVAGEGSERIVDVLFGKKDVNEFSISKKMNLTINHIRNILYKLSAEGLVVFQRKKDKRKGWYIYYWTLKNEKCLLRIEQSLIKKINDLKILLQERQNKRYYFCKICNVESTEEKALEDGFICAECGEVYELSDNTNSIKDIKSKLTRTEKDLNMIREELKKLKEKEAKKAERKNKRETQKKKEAKKKKIIK